MIFESSLANPQTPSDMQHVLQLARIQVAQVRQTPIDTIIAALGTLGRWWRQESDLKEEARAILRADTGYQESAIESSLEIMAGLFEEATLRRRLELEIGHPGLLDGMVGDGRRQLRLHAVSKGVLLHVSAGNIFLGMLDSLIMGLITKNVSLVKMSSNNTRFPQIFFASLERAGVASVLAPAIAFVSWRGGDNAIETLVKSQVDAIIAWGGEDMVRSYRQDLPIATPLLAFGPKLSFQVLTREGLKEWDQRGGPRAVLYRRIAQDVAAWDQAACASPQHLYIQKGIEVRELVQGLGEALREHPIPRRLLNRDEQMEHLKEQARADYASAILDLPCAAGEDYIVRVDDDPAPRPGMSNRMLLVKQFSSAKEFAAMMAPWSFYLQNVGLECAAIEKDEWQIALARAGVKRFSAIGAMLETSGPAPHDGKFPLAHLIDYISDDTRRDPWHVAREILPQIPYYQESMDWSGATWDSIPVIGGETIATHGPSSFQRRKLDAGTFFASGGTTGTPKFIFYSHEEFSQAARQLAFGFEQCGVRPADKVANLFVAGNMWSSFKAVSLALQELGATELPIGGMCPMVDMIHFLKHFKPRVVMGLPGLLLQLANHCAQEDIALAIAQIHFAGENLSQEARAQLTRVFGTRTFYSAGYASVDAGVIGYQDATCSHGEHYTYPDIHLEVIGGEAVVSNLTRRNFPIMRYRTGDGVELLERDPVKGQKFKLLGRLDSQLQIWSCKCPMKALARSLELALGEQRPFQVILSAVTNGPVLIEQLQVLIQGEKLQDESSLKCDFLNHLMTSVPDLAQTHGRTFFEDRISLAFVDSLTLAERTGKIKQLIDRR